MEIIELLFGSVQLCDCCVGFVSFMSAATGTVEARRGKENRIERRIAKREGRTPPPVSSDNWLALGLYFFAIVLLVVVAVTIVGSHR